MEERFIRNISIIFSCIGLIILFLISRNYELSQTNIQTISYEDSGKVVRVCGEVVSKHTSKTQHTFLKLKDDSGTIEIVVFNSTAKKLNLDFDNICVTGTVDEYENKLEIIAKTIKVT
jgi:DNA/RNA endonuclease YhcR with UshA esterase domain